MNNESIQEELSSYLTSVILFFVPFIFNFAFCLAGSCLKVFFNRLNKKSNNEYAFLYKYSYGIAFSIIPAFVITMVQRLQDGNVNTPYFGISFIVGLVSYEISSNVVHLAKWLKAVKAMMKVFKQDFSAFTTALDIASEMVDTEATKSDDKNNTS